MKYTYEKYLSYSIEIRSCCRMEQLPQTKCNNLWFSIYSLQKIICPWEKQQSRGEYLLSPPLATKWLSKQLSKNQSPKNCVFFRRIDQSTIGSQLIAPTTQNIHPHKFKYWDSFPTRILIWLFLFHSVLSKGFLRIWSCNFFLFKEIILFWHKL